MGEIHYNLMIFFFPFILKMCITTFRMSLSPVIFCPCESLDWLFTYSLHSLSGTACIWKPVQDNTQKHILYKDVKSLPQHLQTRFYQIRLQTGISAAPECIWMTPTCVSNMLQCHTYVPTRPVPTLTAQVSLFRITLCMCLLFMFLLPQLSFDVNLIQLFFHHYLKQKLRDNRSIKCRIYRITLGNISYFFCIYKP